MEVVELKRIAAEADALCAAVLDCPSDTARRDRLYDCLATIIDLRFKPDAQLPVYLFGLSNQAATFAQLLREALDATGANKDPAAARRRWAGRIDNLRRVLSDMLTHRD